MSFSKLGNAARKILFCGSVASAILLPYHAAMAAGNSGDTAAPMRDNAAAYPQFYAPYRDSTLDPATERVRHCKKPQGIAASDSRCTRS
jgi:hypothetical protein